MKNQYTLSVSLFFFTVLIHGCSSLSNTSAGKVLSGGGPTVLETKVYNPIGVKNENSTTVFGVKNITNAYAGVIIGRKMDKVAAQVSVIEGVRVDSTRDASNLKALRITFDSGILFPIGGSTLKALSKPALEKFAEILVSNATIDILICGHTDSQGSVLINQKLSQERAQVLADFLQLHNVLATQIKAVLGKGSSEPLRDNNTTIGRAINRRVEVYMYASEQMIQDAQQLAR